MGQGAQGPGQQTEEGEGVTQTLRLLQPDLSRHFMVDAILHGLITSSTSTTNLAAEIQNL